MREHGTRACYVHGTGETPGGCRCEPCTAANRSYARERDRHLRRVLYGIEERRVNFIDAGEVRTHLLELQRRGVGLRTVAAVANVSRSELGKLRDGQRKRCTPAVADRVLLVFPSDAADRARIDATVTWRLLDDLIAHGYTRTCLARLLGSKARVPALQIRRDRVNASTARKVKKLHARLLLPTIVGREQAKVRRQVYRDRLREQAA